MAQNTGGSSNGLLSRVPNTSADAAAINQTFEIDNLPDCFVHFLEYD